MNRRETLETAVGIVCGERDEQYGNPEDNFATIAALWSVYLDQPISSSEVAAMMVLLKLARLRGNPKHADSWVDIAGYAACGAEVAG